MRTRIHGNRLTLTKRAQMIYCFFDYIHEKRHSYMKKDLREPSTPDLFPFWKRKKNLVCFLCRIDTAWRKRKQQSVTFLFMWFTCGCVDVVSTDPHCQKSCKLQVCLMTFLVIFFQLVLFLWFISGCADFVSTHPRWRRNCRMRICMPGAFSFLRWIKCKKTTFS